MLDQTVFIYCVCHEACLSQKIKDDPQCLMNTAEVMTFAIMAASICHGEYRRTHLIAKHYGFFTKILSRSQLTRRIHKVPQEA